MGEQDELSVHSQREEMQKRLVMEDSLLPTLARYLGFAVNSQGHPSAQLCKETR